jgi:hypothetical protein
VASIPPHNRAHSSYSPKIANSGVCFWGTCQARESRRRSGLGSTGKIPPPNRLGGLWEAGSVVSSLSEIRGGSPATNDFGAFYDFWPNERRWWQLAGSSQNTVLKSFNGSLLTCLNSCHSVEFLYWQQFIGLQFKTSTSFSVDFINANVLNIM